MEFSLTFESSVTSGEAIAAATLAALVYTQQQGYLPPEGLTVPGYGLCNVSCLIAIINAAGLELVSGETPGLGVLAQNFEWGSSIGYGNGWFAVRSYGEGGSGGGPGGGGCVGPDCGPGGGGCVGEGCNSGGGGGGPGGSGGIDWWCSYIDCNSDLWNELFNGGNQPDDGAGNGASGNVRPDAKYEEF